MDAPLQASRKGRHHDNSNKHGGEQASSERRRSPSGPQEDFRREQSPEQQQDNHGQHKLSGHPHGGEGARHSQHKQQRRHPKQDHHHHHPKRNIETTKKNDLPEYYVKEQPADENLPNQLTTDPRGDDPRKRITKKASGRGSGRNTESFDPASTLVRPDLRVQVGSARAETFSKVLKHDDVVIVPELFGNEEDWNLYYKLVEEMTVLQTQNVKGAEWIPWHEGAHLIVKKPEASQTFQSILDRLCTYFNIRKESIGYRFNWYKDSSDWKPFHHDSAYVFTSVHTLDLLCGLLFFFSFFQSLAHYSFCLSYLQGIQPPTRQDSKHYGWRIVWSYTRAGFYPCQGQQQQQQ